MCKAGDYHHGVRRTPHFIFKGLLKSFLQNSSGSRARGRRALGHVGTHLGLTLRGGGLRQGQLTRRRCIVIVVVNRDVQ
jgi:hypothetical protein